MTKKAPVKKESQTTAKRSYEKPAVEKHKAATLISGSGCSIYHSRQNGLRYYH